MPRVCRHNLLFFSFAIGSFLYPANRDFKSKSRNMKHARSTKGFRIIENTKFTEHSLKRMEERGIPPEVLLFILKNATSSPGDKVGTLAYRLGHFVVITNKIGDVVTTYYQQCR